MTGRRKINDWLSSYMEYTSNLESPDAFHYWTAVSTVAAALRKRVYIDQGNFKWFPNFFIILVGPPGIVKKSTSIGIGRKFLRELPYIHFGPDVVTWQSFIERLAEARDDVPVNHTDDYINNAQIPVCSMVIHSSELGNFLDPSNKELVNALTDLWDGKEETFEKGTKTQGDNLIENPIVNLIGCTTPGWIQDNFKGRFIEWGFSSRTIMIYRDKVRKLVAYPGLEAKDPARDKLQEALTADLGRIGDLAGSYTMAPDALSLGTDFYFSNHRRLEAAAAAPRPDPYLTNFLARKHGHVHKLAIVIAASRRSELVITSDDLSDAIAKTDEIEDEMHKLFRRQIQIPTDATAKRVFELISKFNIVKEQDLIRALFAEDITNARIKDAINLLLTAALIERIFEDGTFYIKLKQETTDE